MKNGSIGAQLRMQERAIDREQGHARNHNHDHRQNDAFTSEKEKTQSVGLPDMGLGTGLSSALGIQPPPDTGGGGARQSPKSGKKKKRGQGQSSGG